MPSHFSPKQICVTYGVAIDRFWRIMLCSAAGHSRWYLNSACWWYCPIQSFCLLKCDLFVYGIISQWKFYIVTNAVSLIVAKYHEMFLMISNKYVFYLYWFIDAIYILLQNTNHLKLTWHVPEVSLAVTSCDIYIKCKIVGNKIITGYYYYYFDESWWPSWWRVNGPKTDYVMFFCYFHICHISSQNIIKWCCTVLKCGWMLHLL